MAYKVTVTYKRRERSIVLIKWGSKKIMRELEPTAKECSACGVTRKEHGRDFFSYDDFDWLQTGKIHAFCNLTCYRDWIAKGRMSRTRSRLLERALELVAHMEREERKETERVEKRQKRRKRTAGGSGERHLHSVA